MGRGERYLRRTKVLLFYCLLEKLRKKRGKAEKKENKKNGEMEKIERKCRE
jgi:hypothetical protein